MIVYYLRARIDPNCYLLGNVHTAREGRLETAQHKVLGTFEKSFLIKKGTSLSPEHL